MERSMRRLGGFISYQQNIVRAMNYVGSWNISSMSCTGCQIRRFQISSIQHANNSSRYLKAVKLFYAKAAARVMSSSSDSDKGGIVKDVMAQDANDKTTKISIKKPSDVPVETIIKVQPTIKTSKSARKKIDITQSYYDNIYITPLRAMTEYMLESGDLDDIQTTRRRSPYPEKEGITVYQRRDVERKAIAKWGSMESLQKEKKRIETLEKGHNIYVFREKKAKKEYRKTHLGSSEEKPFIFNPSNHDMAPDSIFKHGPGKVVLYAIAINGANCLVKLWAWLYTGSHSMFSEFIHSLADTVNQLILAIGLHQSLKQPDMEHPYGWMTFRNISSLISGVGIFCIGSGVACYHGIQGIVHPEGLDSLYWAMAVLTGSFVSEGATLMVAVNQIRMAAKAEKMSMLEYVVRGQDPSTNVVLLEDMAAVLGVVIALGCMGVTQYTGNPMGDAVGSLLIGTLLGGVASFIIYTNSIALVGRSIPVDKRQDLMKELESDRMIRALHDVKATDMGGSFVRFKAEVDFDGMELTRYYLEKQDLERMLVEMQGLANIEDVETFMLKHGENIVDTLGSEVDRIEKNLKKRHPEIRHVDLEQL